LVVGSSPTGPTTY